MATLITGMMNVKSKFILPKLFFLAALFGALYPASVSAATSFSFSPTTVRVHEGQTVTVTLAADPAGTKNYTVKASITFPADLVSVSAWNFGSEWLPLKQPGYDSLDNAAGTMVRTAGFPNGFSDKTTFGTATFTVKKTGTGTITFAGEQLALDENNDNTYGGGNSVTLVVEGRQTVLPEPAETDARAHESEVLTKSPHEDELPLGEEGADPEQLFDTRFLINEPVVSSIRDLIGTVTFESFGTVPTPVDMEFAILDISGAMIWTSSGSTIVETEQVVTQRFPDLGDLPEGKYAVRLRTLYNTDVEDFFEAPFEIRTEAAAAHAWVRWFLGCCSLLLLGIFLWWFFIFGRKRCCPCDRNDTPCLHDCCRCDATEPDCAERITRCIRDRHMAMYGRTALAFSSALLVIQLIAMTWAKLVTGMWTNLSFLNDVPNILIASFAMASIYAVVRYMRYARARFFILLGLALVALEVFLEVIIKKYVAIRGFSRAIDWFFLFGAVEFIGILCVFVGIVALLGLTKRKNI